MPDREWLIKYGFMNDSDMVLGCDGSWIDPPLWLLELPVSVRMSEMRRFCEADMPEYFRNQS